MIDYSVELGSTVTTLLDKLPYRITFGDPSFKPDVLLVMLTEKILPTIRSPTLSTIPPLPAITVKSVSLDIIAPTVRTSFF
jgi:hypothetical protein